MNKNLKKINKEEILFFTLDVVSNSEELDISSKEYELFKEKIRKSEGELDDNSLNDLYLEKGSLKMFYGSVATISVGFYKEGVFRTKLLKGTEEEILIQFADISSKFTFVCGWNSLGWSLPLITNLSNKYFDVSENLSDAVNLSGKKPWECRNTIDLFDIVKGTYYGAPTLKEALWFYKIEEDLLNGEDINKIWWKGDRDVIFNNSQNKLINLFQLFNSVRWENEEFEVINVSSEKIKELSVKEILVKVANSNSFSEKDKEVIYNKLSSKKLTKEDKENIFEILRDSWVMTDFINKNQDSKKNILQKEEEIKEILDNL